MDAYRKKIIAAKRIQACAKKCCLKNKKELRTNAMEETPTRENDGKMNQPPTGNESGEVMESPFIGRVREPETATQLPEII
jgi:hypothetical protein